MMNGTGNHPAAFATLTRGAAALALVACLPLSAYAQASSQSEDKVANATVVNPAPPRTPAPPSGPSFQGFYVGGLFGQGRSQSDATTTTVFSPIGYFAQTSVPAIATAGAQAVDGSEWTYGFDLGYNAHVSHFVFGGEFDYSSLKISESASTTAVYPCCAPTDFTVTQSIDTTYLMTVRGRAGFTAGPALFYGTVGMAWTDLNYQTVFTDTFATAHENGGVDAKQDAWIYGGGVEFLCGNHFSVKGEYLRADFGTVSATSTNFTAFTPTIAFPMNEFTHSSTFVLQVIRGGVNIRF